MTQHAKRTGIGLAALATLGAGLLVSTDARAHGNDHQASTYGPVAELYDGDNDNVIDKSEWMGLRFDTDRNGVLEGRERTLRDRFVERNPAFWEELRAERGVLKWSELDGRDYDGRDYGTPTYGWQRPTHGPSQAHLSEHDLDRNGYLDRYEMEDLRRHERIEQIFARHDLNRDGVLSFREIRNRSLRWTARRADRDRNGLVTFAELDDRMDDGAPAYRSRRPVQTRVASRPSFRYDYNLRFGF